MNYKILTDTFVFEGKKKGDTVTQKELQEAGLNIAALIAGEHLSGNTTTKSVQAEGAAE